MKNNFFPASLNVVDRFCLVVGNDHEAVEKADRLLAAGAVVRWIGESLPEKHVHRLTKRGALIFERPFDLEDLTDMFFVVFCPKDLPELAKKVFVACRKQKILLCAIDQPAYCDIVNVSVYERGDLKIMVSTNGVAPALAKKIRHGLEESLKDVPLEAFLAELQQLRTRLYETVDDPAARREQLIAAVKDIEFTAKLVLPSKK